MIERAMLEPAITSHALHAPARRWQIVLALAAVYVVWGSTYLAINLAIQTVPPLTMAGARFLLAGAILYAVARRGAPRPEPRQWGSAALVGGLMLLGGNGGVCWAEQHVPTGFAALLIATVPLWTALFDWLRPGGARPRLLVAAGVLTGFAGVALLVRPTGAHAVHPWGAAVLTAAAASWAAGSLAARHVPLPRNLFLASAMEMLAGGALLLASGAAAGEWARFDPAAVSPRSALAVAYLVAFGSLVGFTAFAFLLRHTTSAVATTYAYVNPVVAVALGWAVLGEALSTRAAVAAGVVLAAVALITMAPRRDAGDCRRN